MPNPVITLALVGDRSKQNFLAKYWGAIKREPGS